MTHHPAIKSVTFTPTRRAVNVFVSDLFFNRDVSEAKEHDGGQFTGYNDELMLEEARSVLFCLERLGVDPLPSARELVDDFYNRV